MISRRRSFLLLALLMLLVSCGTPHQWSGTLVDPPQPLNDWTLPDQNGQPFQLSSADQVTLLYFGYTNCPDFCPTTLGNWKQVRQALGADAASVRFALVSIDPERDTEAALKAYVERFDPAFVGLRPTDEQVTAFGREYGFPVEVVKDMAGMEHHDPTRHGTYTYLVDRNAQLREVLRYDIAPAAIAADIKDVLSR